MEALSRIIWLALAALLPLAFMPNAVAPFGPAKAALFRTLALLQICLFAVRLRRAPGVTAPLAILPAFLLVVWTASQAALGRGRGAASLDLAAGAGLFAILVLEGDARLAARMLVANAAAVTVASAWGVGQFLGLDPFTWQMPFALGAPGATYGNPLFLGDGIATALPFTVLATLRGAVAVRAAAFAAALLMSWALVLTQARGAWLGTGAAFILLAALAARRRLPGAGRALLPAAWGLATIVLAAAYSFPGFHNPHGMAAARLALATARAPLDSLRGRFLLWESTALMLRERPLLGFGAGELARQYNEFQGRLLALPRYAGLGYHSTSHSHQDILQAAAEGGVPGAGLTLWLLAAALLPAGFRLARGGGNAASAGALGGTTALLVDGLVNGPMHLAPSAQWMWLLPALAMAAERERARDAAPSAPRAIVAAGLLAAFTALAVRPAMRELLAEGWVVEGNAALERGDARAALDPALRAAALGPAGRRVHFLLGRAWFGLGKWEEAAGRFGADALENPAMASAWHNLGLACAKCGRWDDALVAFRRAAMLNPRDPELPSLIRSAAARAGTRPLTNQKPLLKLRK